MKIRKLKKSEMEYSIRMSEFAFQYHMSDEEREARLADMDPDQTWVIDEGGEIISKAGVLPFYVYVAGRKIKMGGVSGVVTWPEKRRNGLVAKLLKHTLEEMKNEGQVVSFLYPFSVPFYRKYGWELFADLATLTLTKEQLPGRLPHEGYVKRLEKDSAEVDSVYQKWAAGFTGTIVRDEKWWNLSVFKRKKGTLAAYYNSENDMTGYMIYEVKERKMTVHELIWLDADARNGLLTFISNHDSMIESASIKTEAGGPLPFILPDPKIKRDTVSYFMARVVDVKAFLTEFPFKLTPGDPPLILHVNDDFCEWNSGIFIIKPADEAGKHKVEYFAGTQEDTDGKPGSACQHPPKKGIRLSVNTLAALMTGAQSPDLLYREGMIAGDQTTIEKFEHALPHMKPFIYDFF